jgi:hypothetical protein
MITSSLSGFFINLLVLALVFCVPFWGFATVRSRWNMAYVDHVGEIAVYFLGWSLLDLWLFRSVLARAPTNTYVVLPIIILTGTLLGTAGLYVYGQAVLPDVSPHIQRYGRAFNEFAKLDGRYLVAKSCEVLFQQVGLVLSVLILNTILASPLLTISLIASLFGLSHLILYIIRYQQKRVSGASVVIFSLASLLGGGLMALLILLVPFGLIYSFCLHELFYPFVGIGFRLMLSKQ